uniref:PDZ domain-containing protein n=1 Tax=Noctiluca scintillans TaxID=2966 RepID=A0A7S1F7I9_NOCSC|mmetsp:Transcript_40852/g.108288  ORF Transcript_40852/g.108288 Transcript_40852/m.108288 type:complete len:213 (+) Transcript_40852:78-716(+)
MAGEEEGFQALIDEKDRLENEIARLMRFVTPSNEPCPDGRGFDARDAEFQLSGAQQTLACRQSEHMAVMEKVERALAALNAEAMLEAQPLPRCVDRRLDPRAVAVIGGISESSPAQAAGLLLGDEILSFGGVSLETMGDLDTCFAALKQHVDANVGSPLEVVILRGETPDRVVLQLTPEQWNGPGLLGCLLQRADAAQVTSYATDADGDSFG